MSADAFSISTRIFHVAPARKSNRDLSKPIPHYENPTRRKTPDRFAAHPPLPRFASSKSASHPKVFAARAAVYRSAIHPLYKADRMQEMTQDFPRESSWLTVFVRAAFAGVKTASPRRAATARFRHRAKIHPAHSG